MNYDLVIATTTCFNQYGHVPDKWYRRTLYLKMIESLMKSDLSSMNVCHKVSNDEGEGWNENYLKLLSEVRNLAPLCIIVDSDGYFDPKWLDWLSFAIERYPDAAGWSLYKSPRLNQYDVSENERRHTSPHGLCFRTEDYIAPPKGEWFEAFIGELPKKHSMGFIVPTVSLIQHAGQYGLNNIPGGSEDFDPNFPYNKECGLPNEHSRNAG